MLGYLGFLNFFFCSGRRELFLSEGTSLLLPSKKEVFASVLAVNSEKKALNGLGGGP